MVDSSGLENRYSSKQRTIEGSNPSLYFIGFARLSSIKEIGSIKGNGSAKWDSRARKKIDLEDINE